ncbi:MAG TPA: GMC family oxidoreductase N-terminal domain-containing protein [Pseudomonadales bacterium]|nr:GMC family oxidoreductase N-terminal domain-containing protein [Pseudomonadales bacterium]
MEHTDYIVVGAGSAGCALAYRLAASSNGSVLLLEAGSPARNLMLHIPLGFAFLLKPHKNNWSYRTQAEPYLNQREIDLPRGKVLGGCSAINGMVYVRGQAEDFNRWAELGNAGWSYNDVLPYFKRSEDCENGANTYHGTGGPLWVGNVENEFPICDEFIKAAQEAGHALNQDINAASQEGVGYFPHNIKNGKRLSSASAFIDKKIKPGNLTVISDTHVTRIILENKKAVGVEYLVNGKRQKITAKREVVLCGGAINSPKLLELSGIGRRDVLEKAGIAVVHELPGVGENLHDHWNAYIKQGVSSGATYFTESKPLKMLGNLFRYIFKKQGFLTNPAALITVFYKALDNAKTPDAQIHFAPAASNVDTKGNMLPIEGITVASCGVRPTSRGYTHITSSQAEKSPAIQVNYLQTEYDQQVAIAAFKKARAILQQDAMQPYGGNELEPGNAIQSDAEILDYIRNTGDPVHHLAGSCKMGNDNMAVVDEQLRVHGIQNLRVADASIMPDIISGNTHATCVMIGEKAADLLLQFAERNS